VNDLIVESGEYLEAAGGGQALADYHLAEEYGLEPGDVVTLELPMPVNRVYAHEKVLADKGKVALMRGPVVYCLEEVDNGPDLAAIRLPADAELCARRDAELLDGAVLLEAQAERETTDGWDDVLYRPANRRVLAPHRLRAVPYALWNNRGPGEMRVWIRAS
jgi:hypothetical protein